MKNYLYELFGEIFENAQYIEWNVALIVSKAYNTTAACLFEKMQEMTMGQIIGYARNVKFFSGALVTYNSLIIRNCFYKNQTIAYYSFENE